LNIQTLTEAAKIAYTVDDAARVIGVSRGFVYTLFKSGALTARKAGRRTLVTRDDLVRYLESLPEGIAAA
jgi:excisionase family DNA binding protein